MTFAAGIGLGILIAAIPFTILGAALTLWVADLWISGGRDETEAQPMESTC